jgi:hypothetical protein
MKYLALTIEGQQPLQAPPGVPTDGLAGSGQHLIQLGLEFMFLIGIVLCVIMILYSGIQWITSGGEKQQLEKARGRLIYSIVGLVVIVTAFMLVRLVLNLFSANPDYFINLGPTPFPTELPPNAPR